MTVDPDVDLNEDRWFSLGFGLIHRGVCAPANWPGERIAEQVTREDPPGTTANRWEITPMSDTLTENPVQCNDCSNRRHWTLNC